MGEAVKIDTKKLKSAVEEMNALAMEGIDKIRTVGIKTEKMALLFIDAVAAAGKIDEDSLSDNIVDVYNDLPKVSVLNAMLDESGADKKGKKKTKEPKEKKEKTKKEPIPKSRYGHMQSAKSGKLDDALFEGGTMEDIMAALDIPRARFIGHSNHLKNDFGLTLVITEDKEKDPMKAHYKIKEESYTPAPAEK